MVVKQLLPICQCGRGMEFPDGQIRSACKCGVIWELALEGYWFMTRKFAPIVINPNMARAHNYAKWARKQRKAGKSR